MFWESLVCEKRKKGKKKRRKKTHHFLDPKNWTVGVTAEVGLPSSAPAQKIWWAGNPLNSTGSQARLDHPYTLARGQDDVSYTNIKTRSCNQWKVRRTAELIGIHTEQFRSILDAVFVNLEGRQKTNRIQRILYPPPPIQIICTHTSARLGIC